jgi:hypothetical protein
METKKRYDRVRQYHLMRHRKYPGRLKIDHASSITPFQAILKFGPELSGMRVTAESDLKRKFSLMSANSHSLPLALLRRAASNVRNAPSNLSTTVDRSIGGHQGMTL